MGDEKVVGKEDACRAGEGRPQGKGHDLVFRRVDAHGIRGDLVFADGQAGPAVGGVLEILDEKEDSDHNPEHHGERGQAGNAHEARRAADVVDVEDTDADDFAQAQRGNGQIIPVQPQRGQADEEAQKARGHRAGHQGGHDAEAQLDRHNGAHVGADGEKARVADGKLARIAVDHVQARRQDNVDADKDQVQFPERSDDFCLQQSEKNGEEDSGSNQCFQICFA